MPAAIEKLKPVDGVRAVAKIFFQQQNIQGAKFYYLRRVLHDWDDAHCVQILERLTEAMATDSYVLIDKVAIPDMNIHWRTAFEDLHMAVIGGKKRTRAEWETLATQA